MSGTNTENKLTATERLEILENTTQSIVQAIQPLANMAQDLMMLRESVKLLNNKLDSVVKAVNAGTPLTDENINQFMIENNVKELQERVAKMVSDGLLASTTSVSKDSFVVISESDAEGKVVNPRAQFLLSALQNEEIRSKLEGAVVGSSITAGDKGGSLNILEAYNIVVPQAPAQAPAVAEVTSDAVAETATPAAEETAPSPAEESPTVTETATA